MSRPDRWAITLAAREAGRARRQAWKDAGLCVNCGKARDEAQHHRCRRCITACLRWQKAHRMPQFKKARKHNEPWVGPTKALGTVHPRWPSPLRGTVALGLFYGFRRRVA